MSELKEIKQFIQSLADDKVKQDELDRKQQELLEKKELLQSIDRSIGQALQNIKAL